MGTRLAFGGNAMFIHKKGSQTALITRITRLYVPLP